MNLSQICATHEADETLRYLQTVFTHQEHGKVRKNGKTGVTDNKHVELVDISVSFLENVYVHFHI